MATLVPLWSVRYPPMVDLPQHAAQVVLWARLGDPAIAARYQLNPFTPYLLGYAAVRLFLFAVPIRIALKIVVSLCLLGVPLATRALLRAVGNPEDWAIATFPMALGFSFFWGFLNFLVAIPLTLAFLALVYRAVREPGWRWSAAIALGLAVLFFAHVIALGVGLACLVLIVAFEVRPPRRALRLLLPALVPLVLVAAWMRSGHGPQDIYPPTPWYLPPVWLRLLAAPGLMTLNEHELGGAAIALLLILLIVAVARPARRLSRWIPFAVGLGGFLFLPDHMLGAALVFQRFAAFLFPGLVVALQPRPAPSDARRFRAALGLVVIAWMAILTLRFQGFDRHARDFDAVETALPSGASVLSLIFDRSSPFIPGVPFLQFAAWAQVDRGAEPGFSFARFFQELVHYRDGRLPRMTPGLEWHPSRFRWAVDGGYQYFLVRSPVELGSRLFAAAPQPVVLQAQHGEWWLYRNAGASSP